MTSRHSTHLNKGGVTVAVNSNRSAPDLVSSMIIPSHVHHDIPASNAPDEHRITINSHTSLSLFKMIINSFLCNGYTMKGLQGETAVFVRVPKETVKPPQVAIPARILTASSKPNTPPPRYMTMDRVELYELERAKVLELEEHKYDENGNMIHPEPQPPTPPSSPAVPVESTSLTVVTAKPKIIKKRTKAVAIPEETPTGEELKKAKKQRTKKALSEMKQMLASPPRFRPPTLPVEPFDDMAKELKKIKQKQKLTGGKSRKQSNPKRADLRVKLIQAQPTKGTVPTLPTVTETKEEEEEEHQEEEFSPTENVITPLDLEWLTELAAHEGRVAEGNGFGIPTQSQH